MRSRPAVLVLLVALLGAVVFAWWSARAADAPDATTNDARASAPTTPGAATGAATRDVEASSTEARVAREESASTPVLRGRVVDARRTPVPSVLVQAFARAATDPLSLLADRQRGRREPSLGEARTEADGRFAVPLPPTALDAAIEVHFVAETHADALRLVPRVDVDMDLGDCELGAGRTLRGIVRDALSEAPIADAEVAVLLPRQRGLALQGREKGRTARTAADGSYAIEHVPVGHCSIAASAPQHERQEWPQQAIQRDEEPHLDFALEPGRRVDGSVVDGNGNAIANAFVRAVPDRRPELGVVEARAGDDGAFALEGVALGAIALHAAAPGWQSRVQTLADGANGPVRLELEPQGALRVRLVAAGAEPVRDVMLRARGNGPARVRTTPVRTFDEVAAGQGLDVDGLDPGAWTIEVRARGFATTVSAPVVVEAGRASEVQVELQRGAEIEGRVLDANGRPVAGANVRLERIDVPGGDLGAIANSLLAPLGRAPRATTDANGRFLLRDATSGEHAVSVQRRGFAAHRRLRANAIAGQRLLLPDVQLSAGSALRGRATVAGAVDARLVVRARPVEVADLPKGEGFETTVAADGAFAFANLPRGRYEVGAGVRDVDDPFREDADRARSARTVELDGEREATVELDVQPR